MKPDRIRYCTVTTDRNQHRIAATSEANARSHIREHAPGERWVRIEWEGEW